MMRLKIKLFLLLSILSISSFTIFAQTENWRQYSSAMAGFAIKYPSDWTIEKEEAKGQIWSLLINSPGQRDRDVQEHNSIIICSKPKSDSFENLDRCADHHLSPLDTEVVSEYTIKANDLEIRRTEVKTEFSQNTILLKAFFSTKDRDIRITGVFRKIFNLDRFVPVFDEALKTFQSLKEIPVLTYKNELYDFALTYPASWKTCPVAKNGDEEDLLVLVPEKRECNGVNRLRVTRMTKYSNEKNFRELIGFLDDEVFTKIIPYIEFGNVHAALGEKIEKKNIYRERYFYTNYPQTYELLKISEMYDLNNEIYQNEAREILMTTRRFLKFQ